MGKYHAVRRSRGIYSIFLMREINFWAQRRRGEERYHAVELYHGSGDDGGPHVMYSGSKWCVSERGQLSSSPPLFTAPWLLLCMNRLCISILQRTSDIAPSMYISTYNLVMAFANPLPKTRFLTRSVQDYLPHRRAFSNSFVPHALDQPSVLERASQQTYGSPTVHGRFDYETARCTAVTALGEEKKKK